MSKPMFVKLFNPEPVHGRATEFKSGEVWIEINDSEFPTGSVPIAMVSVISGDDGGIARAFLTVRLDYQGNPVFTLTAKRGENCDSESIAKVTGQFSGVPKSHQK